MEDKTNNNESKKDVISKKDIDNIKRKSKYNDEGDEAIADFTYDVMISKREKYEDMYRDYKD